MKTATCVALAATVACHEPPPPARQQATAGLFREVAEESGLHFHHFNGATGSYYLPEIIGSGVAAFDAENDGDVDVLLIQGDFLEAGKRLADASFPPPAGWQRGSRLFRNELVPTGKLYFTDITENSGLAFPAHGMGAAVGDYDGDGFQDLFISGVNRSALYRNRGDGTFSESTRTAGVEDSSWATSATFFDYDRDGWLDLFVAHYVHFVFRDKQCRAETGEPDYCNPQVFNPAVDRLLHNKGNGQFEDVTTASGIGSAIGPGLGVVAGDVNSDGWPDLYVANDGAPSHLWINQHNGTFREQALEAGVAVSMDGKSQAGMGLALADFDSDGDYDVFKSNLVQEGANLYRNLGRGLFYDAAAEYGLLHGTRRYTGFGAVSVDYDNDTWSDLLVVNGAIARVEGQSGSPFPYQQQNQLFRNANGERFTETTADAGPGFLVPSVGRSVALADFNNDGKEDALVTSNNDRVRLFLNAGMENNAWLQVRLKGSTRNVFGIGALVTVLRRDAPPIVRPVHTSSSYLAAGDVRAHFGLGRAEEVAGIRVQWPNGMTESWRATKVNQVLLLEQGSGTRMEPRGAP